jgi:hypothetical protein
VGARTGFLAKLKHELLKLVFVVCLMVSALIFFGGLSLLLNYLGWDHVRFITGTVLACGLYFSLASIKLRPAAGGRRFNIPGIVIGAALVCGAALYAATESAAAFVFCLLVPLVAGGVIAGIKSGLKARDKNKAG